MKSRIFTKLMVAFMVVIAAATLTIDFSIRSAWEDSLRKQVERSLTEKALMFADRVKNEPNRSPSAIAAQVAQGGAVRATIIASDGKVLADSEAQPEAMENHATRPEFIEALHGKVGVSQRWSHTLRVPFLYVAAPIPGGAVRLAYPLAEIQAASSLIRRKLLLASLLAVVVAIALAGITANQISHRLQRIVGFAEQIAKGDLSARIDERSDDEVAHVGAVLDSTARQLERSFAELRQSQQQLETVLNSMQEAVIAVSIDSRVQWANQRMNRLAHVRLDAAVVETVRDPDFLRAIGEAQTARQVSTARAGSLVPGRTFNVTAAPMPGGGAVAVLYDLTEVERVEKTRRDFIANVSHELRTPLTSIQGYAETLLETTDESQRREFIEIIRKNAARMSRLTEDLLALARVESGEQSFAFRPMEAADLLEDAAQNFREIARNHGVELLVENRATVPVAADRDAIHQVFTNMVDNALKYAPTGARIVLGAREVERGVEFFVRDFGPGIASEHLPRLFERFYRVDKARSRESGGTGLGLAIAKHIVLAHGGAIRAESELNHGSTFVFVLPFAAKAQAEMVNR